MSLMTVKEKIQAYNNKTSINKDEKNKKELNDYVKTKPSRKTYI